MAETLNADASVSGTVTDPANALGASDGTFTTDSGNTNWTHRWGLDNLVGTIETDQTITVDVVVRKDSAGGNDPAVTSVDVLDNGVSLGIDSTGWSITTIGETINASVAVTGIATNGDNLQVEIVTTGAGGSPTSRRAVQIDSIEATVQNATASITGSGAITEASDTISGSGGIEITGTGTVAEAADTLSGVGDVEVSGASTITEAPDTVSGAGGVEVSGSGAIAEAADQIAGSGGIEVSGSGAMVENPDVLSGQGTVGVSAVSGSGAVVETADQVSGSGGVEISGVGAAVESSDAIVAVGGVEITGSSSVGEAVDLIAGAGTVGSPAVQGPAHYSRIALPGNLLITGGG
jgi:filamentous hemagglutinin